MRLARREGFDQVILVPFVYTVNGKQMLNKDFPFYFEEQNEMAELTGLKIEKYEIEIGKLY